MQTDSLEGSAVSLDDSSKSNLDRLVQTAKNLLNEPVAERDFSTGDLVPIPTGETNGEALRRYTDALDFLAIQYLDTKSGIVQIHWYYPMCHCYSLLLNCSRVPLNCI